MSNKKYSNNVKWTLTQLEKYYPINTIVNNYFIGSMIDEIGGDLLKDYVVVFSLFSDKTVSKDKGTRKIHNHKIQVDNMVLKVNFDL